MPRPSTLLEVRACACVAWMGSRGSQALPCLSQPPVAPPLTHAQTCTRLLAKGESGCFKLLDRVKIRLGEDEAGVLKELKGEPRLVAVLARVGSGWAWRV